MIRLSSVTRLIQIVGVLFIVFSIWETLTRLKIIPNYMVPSPYNVVLATWENRVLLYHAAQITGCETLGGFLLGAILGTILALLMIWCRSLRHWFFPFILAGQAVPVFAVAPLLVLWFGFGSVSKIVTTMLVIFFPLTSAFLDGLMRTPSHWLDLASTMGASRWQIVYHIKIPAAIPSFASGLRLAATFSPIGAVVGEWVGASAGLGYIIQISNNRLQTDLTFAALGILIIMTLVLWQIVNVLLNYCLGKFLLCHDRNHF